MHDTVRGLRRRPSQSVTTAGRIGRLQAMRRVLRATGAALAGVPAWRRYLRTGPMTIVVLGMHRSGTSCITRMLNLCGAGIGASVIGANASNKAGHWEPAEGIAINDALLARSGGSWDSPPEALSATTLLEFQMRGFLGRLHRYGTAVWKDPRTVVTYPLWQPLIQQPLLVGVFRNPMSVACSLQRRNGLSLEEGLQLWYDYNTRLLAHTAQAPETYWIDFDQSIDDVFATVGAVAVRTGLEPKGEAKASYTPELRTSDASENLELCTTKVRDLYEQLSNRARQTASSNCSAAN